VLVVVVTYKTRLVDFFQLTLEQRIKIEDKNERIEYSQPNNPYDIIDACSFLEQLRAYQLADILGKYKLF